MLFFYCFRLNGVFAMRWGVLIDADSLYIEMQSRFGATARMDYLKLPDKLCQTTGIEKFDIQRAMVMRRGRAWESFANFMKDLGYKVIHTDKSVQPITFSLAVTDLMSEVDGIVLVTASQRIGPILERLLYSNKEFFVATFFEKMEVEGRELAFPGLLVMDESWLWNGEQLREVEAR